MLERKIIQLNLSQPGQVIGFNPFQTAPAGDISVQVDRRVTATCHAWGVSDTDQTPTLARTLRLIYAVMLEHNLGLPQVRHLIDFNGHEIRAPLIEQLEHPADSGRVAGAASDEAQGVARGNAVSQKPAV